MRIGHRVVNDVLNQGVLESVGPFCLTATVGDAQSLQLTQKVRKMFSVGFQRIDVPQSGDRKSAPDHAAHLERELLWLRQAVYAAGDNPLHRAGEIQSAEMLFRIAR